MGKHTICLLLGLYFLITLSTGEYIPPGPRYNCPTLNQIWPCICLTATDDGVSLHCEDVSLATLSAALTSLSKLEIPLESIRILNLNTEQLYGILFEGLNITKITIEDSPIKIITPDVFFNVKHSLKELEIINSQVDVYSNDVFRDLENLESLTIDRHFISNLSEPIKGLQNLKALKLSNGNIIEISKVTFSNLGKLNRLDLHGNQIKDIPKDALMALKNLEFFDLAFNNFTKFENHHFNHLTKLTWFNGSHNEIRDFPKTFARNAYLRVIYLTHNKITKLDSQALRGMRFLRRLYLSDNLISEVSRSTFASILKVGTIDLARNKLRVLDYQTFSQLIQAEVLDVAENQIQEVKKEAFKDLSYVFINMSYNQIHKFDKDAFVNCINITVLDMSHNNISNFTRGTFDENTFPSVLKLEYNKLKNGADLPLKYFSGLKILNVSYNELEMLGKGTFPKLYELHTIDLSHNNISNIFSSVFTTLYGLRSLNLSYNSMTGLRGSIFGAISTLLELEFNHNEIASVSGSIFTQLPSLRHLSLNNNKLTSVFQIPQSLSTLDVSNNQITTLSKAFPVMNALLRLDLSGNNLAGVLQSGSFSNLGSCQELLLSRNGLTEVPKSALGDFRVLQFVDLSENLLQNLTRSAFGSLTVLLNVRLNKNNITEIAEKAFDGLIQLRYLDLSENNIHEIPVGAFGGLTGLKSLNLSRNYLQKTDNGTHCIFEDNLSLYSIDLSYNQVRGISALTFPAKQWTPYRVGHVNLSHNYITTITKNLLTGTYRLESLNLGFNQINDIRPGVFKNLTLLEELYLNNNNIGAIDINTLGPPPSLIKLDLSNNIIRKFPPIILTKSPYLEFINLTWNHIQQFDQDYLPKIKNGTRILLNNNSLHCDCRLVSLLRFLNTFRPKLSNFTKEFYEDFQNFKCTVQESKQEKELISLNEYELRCDYSIDYNAPIISQNYDLEVRRFIQHGNDVELIWRVRSKEDVTHFNIFGQDEFDNELFNEVYMYNVRSAKLININSNVASICIRPKYSKINEIRKPPKICQQLDKSALSKSLSLSYNSGMFRLSTTLFMILIIYNNYNFFII